MDSERIMRITSWFIEKPIAVCMVLLLMAPVARAEPLLEQEAAADQGAQGAPPPVAQQGSSASTGTSTPSSGMESPTSSDPPAPGARAAQSGGQGAAENDSQVRSADPQASSADSQGAGGQEQNSPAKPVGTAAAPGVKSTGVAGSRVSGAAIAPAKQSRVRTFLIRVALSWERVLQ